MTLLPKKQSLLLGGYYDFERPKYPDPYKNLGKLWPMASLKPKSLETKPINPYLLPFTKKPKKEHHTRDFYPKDTTPHRSLRSYNLKELHEEREQAERFEQNIGGMFGRDSKTGSFRLRTGPHHIAQSIIGTAVPAFGLATSLMRAVVGAHHYQIDKEIARRKAEAHSTYPLKERKRTSRSTRPRHTRERHYRMRDVTVMDRPRTFSRDSFRASPERHAFERTDRRR